MLIDVHAHIGRIVPDRREFVDAANLIAKMDKWGIDLSCVLALSEHSEAPYLESTTEDVLAACARYPKRLIPFCTIDPRFAGNNPKADFRWLLDEYKARGCRGIGEMLPKMNFDDPRCLNLFRQAAEFEMPVLFDAMDSETSYGLVAGVGLARLEKALQECPRTVFIGHGPTFWAEISAEVPPNLRSAYPKGPIVRGGAVPALMRRYPNLWADTSAGSGHNALTREPAFGIAFLDEFQDKMLFGTDSCVRSDVDRDQQNTAYLRRLGDERKLTPEAWEKIAWKNAVRLLKLQGFVKAA
jgi:uncharacterized protein